MLGVRQAQPHKKGEEVSKNTHKVVKASSLSNEGGSVHLVTRVARLAVGAALLLPPRGARVAGNAINAARARTSPLSYVTRTQPDGQIAIIRMPDRVVP